MQANPQDRQHGDELGRASWIREALTDSHFWVPLAVLIGGLVLLRSVR